MNMFSKQIILMAGALFLISSCQGDDLNEKSSKYISVVNNGFENDAAEVATPSGWTITGDANAAKVVKGGYNSEYGLYYTSTTAYKVCTEQVLTNLTDGIYDLSFRYKNSGNQNACYVMVGEEENARMTSLQVSKDDWAQSKVKGVKVEGGKCSIKIYSDANADNWSLYDDIKIEKTNNEYMFYKGADVSELSYVEQMGGVFRENGESKDCFDILYSYGINLARLRLYNDPGNPNYTPSNRLPAGIQNPDDILRLAKRAKEHNMEIALTFHYSDYWSQEYKPHAWVGISFEELRDSVYTFTYEFMKKMEAQGTTPKFAAIGNEINDGILYPDGQISRSWEKFATLFNAGYQGVKDASPSTQVVLHITGATDPFDDYFTNCEKYGVKFDIVGASWYPFWHQSTATQMKEWSNNIYARFGKKIIIMETGYPWNPILPDGSAGQLSNNGPYQDIYPSSEEGQRDFLLELYSEIKKSNDGCILGDIYWDPVMIEVEGVGWELGADNVVSNTTLFDFQGNSLKSLNVFKYNN